MITPIKQKRKADDMADSLSHTPAKRRVTAQPKKRLSIPGAFPSAELSSQETSQRSAHSVVSARTVDVRQAQTSRAAPLPKAQSKPTIASNRVQKSTTRQPSTPRKQRSSKKLSVVTPKAERQSKRQDVTMRFSFSNQLRNAQGPLKKGRRRGRPSSPEDALPYKPVLSPIVSPTKRLTPHRRGKEDKVLNRSFSELLVTTAQNNLTGPLKHDYTDTPSDLSSEPNHEPKAPDPSVFSHPSKKREGYGFSYSEPLWYDSDEYPDTECDWDPKDDGQSAPLDALFDQSSSFEDIVVMRDVGSFHIAKPQRILQCTKATREDTVRLKQRAKTLFKWDESGNVYSSLVGRLERMVYSDLEKKFGGRDSSVPSVVQCASKLKDFLQRNKEERIETGESRRAVEHEIEWATWLTEASRTGVMHLKTQGCSCRPDWEED
ncbi:hypothetical protein C7974DRAFT_220110 [Boeremia exigua]|uniref:uncharacterized protein n=1 Tax=Boeremia exigua TaxID=749465 RepID=UPI001E8CE31D|nr:uncharacterized protein C7974DRAFT_220110 [Boeremia exigua]KAH6622325.1 hypothetical protein C7974DRAFT_220110 [Boeremia exigua]